ncbi:hypothetical protein E2C01_049784 [Portunus trituberculatus]|uniref:Uncharacterized protein n=1 Tax=Portunus trituberculatus TaxID=210409 RepID=A0A5B7GE15_PORTR|nr:hypothetical protein [Portunus trituberculatus]
MCVKVQLLHQRPSLGIARHHKVTITWYLFVGGNAPPTDERRTLFPSVVHSLRSLSIYDYLEQWQSLVNCGAVLPLLSSLTPAARTFPRWGVSTHQEN